MIRGRRARRRAVFLKAAPPLVVGQSNRSEVGGERKSIGPYGTSIFKRVSTIEGIWRFRTPGSFAATEIDAGCGTRRRIRTRHCTRGRAEGPGRRKYSR